MNSDEALEIIQRISKISGNAKQTYLRQFPEIQPYLLAAYDPFKKYNYTQCAMGVGSNIFTDLTWEILSKINTRELSGNDGQIIIDIHTNEMTYNSAELFRRILNKDLRMGMGIKSINKVFKDLIPVHDVMLAKLFNKDKVRFPCWGSPKLDGVRGDYKDGMILSRNGHPYNGLQHIINELSDINYNITGELVIPKKTFQESSGLIRNDYDNPDAKFYIIDLTSSIDDFVVRLERMKLIVAFKPHIVKVPHILLKSFEDIGIFYNKCKEKKFEGAVIKPYNYKYKGTRSWDWMKLKPILDKDFPVIDIYEGKGKYKGMLGGVIVDIGNNKIEDPRVGSGFSDSERYSFWQRPETIIGQVIEVQYMEKTDGGSLRHARYKGIRSDKNGKRN